MKESKVVKWDNLLNPIDGEIKFNSISFYYDFHLCINISENETVAIEEEIHRADINKVMVHTNKVVREKEINKAEAENEFKKVMTEYNHTVIDNDSKMKAYCNVNKIDIDTVDIDDLEKICINKCDTHSRIAITSDYGNEYSLGTAISNTINGLETFYKDTGRPMIK